MPNLDLRLFIKRLSLAGVLQRAFGAPWRVGRTGRTFAQGRVPVPTQLGGAARRRRARVGRGCASRAAPPRRRTRPAQGPRSPATSLRLRRHRRCLIVTFLLLKNLSAEQKQSILAVRPESK